MKCQAEILFPLASADLAFEPFDENRLPSVRNDETGGIQINHRTHWGSSSTSESLPGKNQICRHHLDS